jgi:hypothetical protein
MPDDKFIDLSKPIEVEFTAEIEDRDAYERLVGYRPRFEGEIVGGRWDGLPVVWEPMSE